MIHRLFAVAHSGALLASEATGTQEEPESMLVSGVSPPCREVATVGDEFNRYECDECLDDDRVSGISEVTVTTVDYSVSPTAIAGTWRLENDGGVWDGDWIGVIESDGLHRIEGVMAGSRGYDGLVYRVKWEYYNDGDITASGVIESAS